jgi:hypothetical protein
MSGPAGALIFARSSPSPVLEVVLEDREERFEVHFVFALRRHDEVVGQVLAGEQLHDLEAVLDTDFRARHSPVAFRCCSSSASGTQLP